jgi:hypothetical protein
MARKLDVIAANCERGGCPVPDVCSSYGKREK